MMLLLFFFYCPHFFLMLLKLSIFVSIVDCSQCFGFVSALLWLTHHMRLTNREILMAKFQPFVDWFTGWFAFSSLILFHSLHTLVTIKQNVGIQCITQQIQCMAMVNKNVTIWHADLWMRKYLFMVQQTTNASINNMRCTYFVFSFFFHFIFIKSCGFCVCDTRIEMFNTVGWTSSWPRRNYTLLHNFYSSWTNGSQIEENEKLVSSLRKKYMKRIKYKMVYLSMLNPFNTIPLMFNLDS